LLGYNVEYSSIGFALFFIAEYTNIIFVATLSVILFLGGWLLPSVEFSAKLFYILAPSIVPYNLCIKLTSPIYEYLGLLSDSFILTVKVIIMLYVFIWVRAGLPRYRYDQLMYLGWKIFLPISLAYVPTISIILFNLRALPTVY